MRNGSYAEPTGRRLLTATGELSQLAGWVASDAGHLADAQRMCLSGASAAQAAGNDPLVAQLFSTLSYQLANNGNPADALLLARSAVKGAAEATPVVRALLLERVAWASAKARDRESVRAATVASVLADMLTAGLPTLDPAAVVGYALRTGAVAGEHKLKRVAEWAADAYAFGWPGGSLDFHIDLLIEASYRRHVTVYAKRLQQAEKDGALDLLDEQVTAGYARLAAHRQRFVTILPPVRPVVLPAELDKRKAA